MHNEVIHIGDIPVKVYTDGEFSRTVLAVHGFGGSKDSLAIEGLAERLCPVGFRVAAPDLPCHGERTETESRLSPENCISEIMAVERELSAEYAFGTSFGGALLLRRIELYGDPFRRIVLRVPAVNMADSLLRCMQLFQPGFTLEQAESSGFHVKMSRELNIPYSFYGKLLELNEVRHCAAWNTPDILAVYAGSDELVARKDTEEFLRLNPEIQRLCIEGSGHRMNQKPEYLSARRHPVHRNVEEAAKLPHREKEIRRQKDDEQTSPKPGMPATVLQQRHNDTKCCSAVCDNVHNRDRI